MAVYGNDLYDKGLYGTDLLVDYRVSNLEAQQLDYGRITVSWDAPRLNNWTELILVRSGYGFPVAPTDGTPLATIGNTGSHTSYDDIGLTAGYWYYTVFVSTPFPTWSAAVTYQIGDIVSYSSTTWVCVAASTFDITPGSNAAYWTASTQVQLWHPAGSVASLCVQDLGNGPRMDSLIPNVYKAQPGQVIDPDADNASLAAFTGILGFGFDMVGTELDDLDHPYDVVTARQDRLYEISQMLGVSAELASSARYQRLRTLHAAELNQQKGTVPGLIAAVHAASGLSCTVNSGPNMMLSQDQSAFVFPMAPAWDPDRGYQIGDTVTYQGVRYACAGFTYTVTPANYGSTTAAGGPNALGTATVGGVSVVKETSTTQPSTVTTTFTAPSAASYTISWIYGSMPDGGIVSILVDGVVQQFTVAQANLPGHGLRGGNPPRPAPTPLSSVDTYAATGIVAFVAATTLTLTAASHTVVLSSTTKNAASTGYSISAQSLTIAGSPIVFPPGTAPTGMSGSANQWATAPAWTDSTTYANPSTGGMGTWTALTTMPLSIQYLGA